MGVQISGVKCGLSVIWLLQKAQLILQSFTQRSFFLLMLTWRSLCEQENVAVGFMGVFVVVTVATVSIKTGPVVRPL